MVSFADLSEMRLMGGCWWLLECVYERTYSLLEIELLQLSLVTRPMSPQPTR